MKAKIGHRKYDIQYLKRVDDVDAGQDLAGCIRYADRKILICADQHAEDIPPTLLHEIIHAVSMERNLKMTENQVVNLANGLYEFILDNPKLAREIFNP